MLLVCVCLYVVGVERKVAKLRLKMSSAAQHLSETDSITTWSRRMRNPSIPVCTSAGWERRGLYFVVFLSDLPT